MHGSAAFRGDFRTHVDDEALAMQEADYKERQQSANAELRELATLASLNDHPGWQMIRGRLEQVIQDYRSGEKLRGAMLDPTVTNDQLGELTRTTMLVADELDMALKTVDVAVDAMEQEKDLIREQRPQPRGN